jgi:hypothetical protein
MQVLKLLGERTKTVELSAGDSAGQVSPYEIHKVFGLEDWVAAAYTRILNRAAIAVSDLAILENQ